jgi:hypothetical protein
MTDFESSQNFGPRCNFFRILEIFLTRSIGKTDSEIRSAHPHVTHVTTQLAPHLQLGSQHNPRIRLAGDFSFQKWRR